MTNEEFKEYLKDQVLEDKVVRMRTRYGADGDWDYENEILIVSDMQYEWLSDWDEGQDQVEILGCIDVSDINVPLFESNSNEDCISRAELLKHQRSLYDEYLMDWVDVVEVKTIENMQSIQTKAKVGHWGKTRVTGAYYGYDFFTCSHCGDKTAHKYEYCPNCGAKMEDYEET